MTNEPLFHKSIKLVLEPGNHTWCMCADNHELVICDSNHNQCDTLEFEITEKRLRSYCTCKQTKTPPFCDGFHKEINAINFPE